MKETLKYLRENHNLTQSDLAEKLGISRQMYIKYENGEVEPAISTIKRLAKFYKVEYSTIIDNFYKTNPVEYQIPQEKTLLIAEPNPNALFSQNYFLALQFASNLNFSELIKLLSEVVKMMTNKNEKAKVKSLTQKENMSAFKKFTGAIHKNYEDVSYKDLLVASIDERYASK